MIDSVIGQTKETGIMAVQFSGSRSAGDRRRRRLVVNGDGTALESTLPEGEAGEMESQLVASEAAGPWVPATEMRIWIYASVIAVGLGLLTYGLFQPKVFHRTIEPLTSHLLIGYRPVLVVGAQTIFLALAAQMGMLISWYRARCRLDFGGRYRIWPWASAILAVAAFCSATETHQAFATVVSRAEWLSWRPTTVAWLLPFCVVALPITLWVDRDMRNSRSSLYTFRVSQFLAIVWASFEIFQPELKSQSWYNFAVLLVPLFASATLFISLWHHARVVAYVCPDPPELDQQSAWSLLLGVAEKLGSWVSFWKWIRRTDDDDASAKPKRRRKKVEAEPAAAKRKRKAPVKRSTTTTKSRAKPVEEEVEEEEEVADTSSAASEDYETEEPSTNESSDQSSWDDEQEQWNEKPAASTQKSKGNGRNLAVDDGHRSSAPAPHSRRTQQASWANESNQNQNQRADASNDESEDDSSDDQQYQNDSGLTADQLKGMSKRQKRELRKQMRDQERTRGR